MIIPFKKKTTLSATYFIDHAVSVFALFLIFIVISSVFIDKPLALFFAETFPNMALFFSHIQKLFCPMFWVLIPQLLFFYIRFFLRQEKKSRPFWYISLSLPLTILTCFFIEILFGKANPTSMMMQEHSTWHLLQWDASFHSFPSMTASIIAGITGSFACLFSRARIPLYAVGFLGSFLPVLAITAGFGDCLAGFFLGTFNAQWIFKKMKKELSF